MESEDDDWELCYDDGFVYKRKRRRLNPPEPVNSSEPDSEILRKERKKHTLLKLKSKYEKEILQWENLSNTLRSLQISSSPQLQQQQQQQHQTLSLPSTSSSTQSNLLDDLLSQVEAQEAIIHDISNLCDVAEAMCFKQEQLFKQSLFDLPIWSTPHELMQALCYDD
ncbi:uncharacterized protein LOC123906665 [Trifolium pratense]|uniref:uncharacterized protein LOC123906665 n=1 Tax=Trifolium pratense TaxID=57577 RepID=UPI001E695690|nr:uncharacterized protein LOC123906665 [Trifolium pratense]